MSWTHKMSAVWLVLAAINVIAQTDAVIPQWLQNAQQRADRHPVCASMINQLVAQLRETASPNAWKDYPELTAEVRRCLRENTRAAAGYEYAARPMTAIDVGATALATLDDSSNVFVWNFATGRGQQITQLQHPWPPTLRRGTISLAPDGAAVAVSSPRETQVFTTSTRQQVATIRLSHATLTSQRQVVGLEPLGRLVQIWQVDPQQASANLQQEWPVERARDLIVSGNAAYAWTGKSLLDLATGQTAEPLPPSRDRPAAFSPDSQTLYVSSEHGTVHVVDVARGTTTRTITLNGAPFSPGRIQVSQDNTVLALTFTRNTVFLLETTTGQLIARHENDKRVASFAFTGADLLIATDSGATKLVSTDGTEQARLVSFASGHWAALTPEGFYDAANAGQIDELRWRAQRLNLRLDQLKESFWQPGLLAELLAGALPTNTASLGPPPEVTVRAPTNGVAPIQVNDLGGGIGRVRILVNGKEVESEYESGQIQIPRDRVLAGEQNTLEVRAWNETNDVSSRGVKVVWQDSTPAQRNPRLFAIVVGTSDYRGGEIDLSFAASDAERFGSALQVGANELFGEAQVDVRVLSDADVTKRALASAFGEARALRPTDLFVIYLSGHGVSRDGEYYYLMSSAGSLNTFAPEEAVSSAEFTAWINAIAATKQAMVLDTCAAGAVTPTLLAARGPPSAQVRAIERLKDRTGFHVLMGSAADRVSYEASFYGQGLLTYALLEGMRGEALREAQFVDVSRLFQHALDRVPQLATHLGGIQQPILAAPRADSFDIGMITRDSAQWIRLNRRRAVITDITFVEASSGFDRLNLGGRLEQQLSASQGLNTAPVLLLGGEVPGGLKISGSYTDNGDSVAVKLRLLRDNTVIRSEDVVLKQTSQAGDLLLRPIAADLEVPD